MSSPFYVKLSEFSTHTSKAIHPAISDSLFQKIYTTILFYRNANKTNSKHSRGNFTLFPRPIRKTIVTVKAPFTSNQKKFPFYDE